MTTPSQEDWQRLGDLLIQRRVELDARYRYRNAFADDARLDWRLLYDIEKARRTNFTRSTLAAIEVAYRLQPGSIQALLDRDEDTLVPLPEPDAEPEPELRINFDDDPELQAIWDEHHGKDGLLDRVLLGGLYLARDMRRLNRDEERRSA